MAIIDICNNPTLRVALLAIDQGDEYYLKGMDLDAEQEAELKSQHSSHRLEWLASRWLLCQMTGTTTPPYTKDEFGKPQFKNGEAPNLLISTQPSPLDILQTDYSILHSPFSILNSQFSISHTLGYAAVIISDRAVGIDVQGFEEKTMRIRGKFIATDDLSMYESNIHFQDIVHLFWGAKESMYKAWGKRGIDFRQHLFMEKFHYNNQGGKLNGHLEKGDAKMRFTVEYQIVEKQYLVWVKES